MKRSYNYWSKPFIPYSLPLSLMKNTYSIILFLFFLIPLNLDGQEKSPCDSPKIDTKMITYVIDTNSYGFKEVQLDYFNMEGLRTKTAFIYDSLLTRIDTFIYNSENKLVRREGINPISRKSTQKSTFLYDESGSNYRTLTSSIHIQRIDSTTIDTNYSHIRYDFIRDENERFTERRTYYSMTKVADYDTSKFDITYQTFMGDSIVKIEDHYAGRVEYFEKHYQDCRIISTKFFDAKKELLDYYEYEYYDFDERGDWHLKKVYYIKGDDRRLINTHHQEIEYY
ncbi:MAG: hypothetical protein COA32_16535 [Fluviicola sp.]|nr:MAG: hypothetical protein COA32_16535 [Fluviicola sp.]